MTYLYWCPVVELQVEATTISLVTIDGAEFVWWTCPCSVGVHLTQITRKPVPPLWNGGAWPARTQPHE